MRSPLLLLTTEPGGLDHGANHASSGFTAIRHLAEEREKKTKASPVLVLLSQRADQSPHFDNFHQFSPEEVNTGGLKVLM